MRLRWIVLMICMALHAACGGRIYRRTCTDPWTLLEESYDCLESMEEALYANSRAEECRYLTDATSCFSAVTSGCTESDLRDTEIWVAIQDLRALHDGCQVARYFV